MSICGCLGNMGSQGEHGVRMGTPRGAWAPQGENSGVNFRVFSGCLGSMGSPKKEFPGGGDFVSICRFLRLSARYVDWHVIS